MVHALRFPPHIATATSQFVVAFIAFSSTAMHLAYGDLQSGTSLYPAMALAIGVAAGAQIGARLSRRVDGGSSSAS